MRAWLRMARPPVIRSGRVLAWCPLALVTACSNDREHAVIETLKFARQAPYTLAAPLDRYGGFHVAVKDSALPEFNKVFKYFDPNDTTKAETYNALPSTLLATLPVTSYSGFNSQRLGDTLKVSAIITRPDRKLFERSMQQFFHFSDTLPPTSDQRSDFERSLARAKRELQESDTAYFWVVAGPRIVGLTTASDIRDSVAKKALTDSLMKRLRTLVANASFSGLHVERYSIPSLEAAGSVSGLVNPGPEGWPKDTPKVYIDLYVVCEASNRDAIAREESHVILSSTFGRSPDKVLCLWVSDDAQKWKEIHPQNFRVRLVGKIGRDSVEGNWVNVSPR